MNLFSEKQVIEVDTAFIGLSAGVCATIHQQLKNKKSVAVLNLSTSMLPTHLEFERIKSCPSAFVHHYVAQKEALHKNRVWIKPSEHVMRRWQWENPNGTIYMDDFSQRLKKIEGLLGLNAHTAGVLQAGESKESVFDTSGLRALQIQTLPILPNLGAFAPEKLKARINEVKDQNYWLDAVQLVALQCTSDSLAFIDYIVAGKQSRVIAKQIVLGLDSLSTPLLLKKFLPRALRPKKRGEFAFTWGACLLGLFDPDKIKSFKMLEAVRSPDDGAFLEVRPAQFRDLSDCFFSSTPLKNLMALKNQALVAHVLIDTNTKGTLCWQNSFNLDAKPTRSDNEKFKRTVALMADIFFRAGAQKCFLPHFSIPVLHSIDDIPKLFSSTFPDSDTTRILINPTGTLENHMAILEANTSLSIVDSSAFLGQMPAFTLATEMATGFGLLA